MLRPSFLLIVVHLLVLPMPAIAQRVIDAAAFLETAAPAAVPSGFGGAFAYGNPLAQLRLSGRTGALEPAGEPRFWHADLDLRIAPLNAFPVLRSIPPYDAEPYLFIGGGTRFLEAGAGAGARWDPSFSWGAGVRLPVLGQFLALYGEGRNRSGDWEARGGVGFRFIRGSGPGSPAPPPEVEESPSPEREESSSPGPAAADIAGSVLAEAERHLGVRYVWGGDDPQTGFDCSGFVQFVYAKFGIALPRVTREQARAGSAVPLDRESFRPGDLLFFASGGRKIHHVAIYAGGGRIIHAPSGSARVRFDDLGAPEGRWYRERLVEARRVF